MDCMRDAFEGGKSLNGRFLTIAPLNHGSFGMVFSAKDVFTGSDVAIKCITKADAVRSCAAYPSAVITDECSEELAIHSRLRLHPNIVNLIHHFETAAHQYMALELCGNGDLYEAIRHGRGPLETEHVRAFLLELVDAIEHLHRNGVYHRDIKPENIFLTSSGAMKLGDFGLATTDSWSTEFAVGSDRYMAPEQYEPSVYGYGYSPAAADVWAIGIVLLNVLFERNPFAFPTDKDPLFADFKGDRESLFDVFPKMSRDTFNVLVHCLAVDPANRSLSAVRNAVNAVISFTENDETLDDFCIEQGDQVAVANSAREPLRTPSITSPTVNGDSFPFTTGLLKTPQKPVRQLSTIHDDDLDLFPEGPSGGWQYIDTDQASLASNVDSGLGMSYKSSKSMQSMKSTSSYIPPSSTIVGSLPISFTKPANKSLPYGGDGSTMSKSWSDMIEEDFAMEQERSSVELDMDLDEDNTPRPGVSRTTTINQDSGSSTPRQVLAESDVNVVRSGSPARKPAEKDKTDADAPKPHNALFDRWAVLGKMRREKPDSTCTIPTTASPTTQKTSAFANFSPFSSSSTKKQKSQDKFRDRSMGWRQGSPERLRSTNNRSQVWGRQDSPTHGPQNWELDNNWREHKPPVPKIPSPESSPSTIKPNDQRKTDMNFLDTVKSKGSENDTGDFEWVVGGHKFEL